MIVLQQIFQKALSLSFLFFLFSCNSLEKQRIAGAAQGTTYSVVYVGELPAEQVKPIVEACLERIDASMSTYRAHSLISKINNGENLPLDDDFIQVFNASKEIYLQTEGYFDPSIGKLIAAWGFGHKEPEEELTKQEVDSLLRLSGLDKVHLKAGRLVKEVDGIELNFNAIAQGYTADAIGHELEKVGIHHYIVEVGGELFVKGKDILHDRKWVIGVDNPLLPSDRKALVSTLSFESKGLATSGNYRKVRVDSLTGKKIVHTLNPKTGYPEMSNLLSATVIAPTAMLADGYATAFMARGLEWSKAFAQAHPELGVLFLYTDEKAPNELLRFTNETFEQMIVNQ